MRACASCGRTLGKVAARCLYCGTAATDLPAAAGPAAGLSPSSVSPRKAPPVLVTCPGCLRNARVTAGEGTCSYCALTFTSDDDGQVRVGRARSTPSAPRAHVERLVAQLPSARLWDVVRDVLLRRAAFDELGAGEAERAVDALTLIATWPGESSYWVPVALADAVTLLPRLLLGVSDGARLDEHGYPVVLSTIGTRNRPSDVAAARAGVNILGFASQLATGIGFRSSEPDHVETQTRVQIRLTLTEEQGGLEIIQRDNQIDQQPSTRFSVTQERELLARIAATRPLLAGYHILGALFGPSCRRGTAFSITRDAIARRLDQLGCDSSPELVDSLCVRMPRLFGT